MERSAPLAMAPDTFRALGHELIDRIADFLGSMPDRPVTGAGRPPLIQATLGADRPLPDAGTDPAVLLRTAADLLFEHSLFNGHPGFLGYITASPAPIGMLGDLLAAAVNPNVGSWTLAPMASAIEAQTVRWIGEIVGYREGAAGLLVSGGNMANFLGFLAARAAAADWAVRETGLRANGSRALRVYASAETHTWIQKATDLFGLGTDAIRWIPTDPSLRMDVALLRAAIARDVANGDLPMLVVGTAGSVSTGAVDPFFEIAAACREAGVWFHIDGAYGGFAACVPDSPEDLRAIHLADSVAVDPHKWLYAPLEAGCTLVRDVSLLRDAFSYRPSYYHFDVDAVTNYVDLGMQNSRGFRALKVWLALAQVGRDGYVRMIGDDMRLAERLHTRIGEHPDFENLTLGLSIATFRYVPPDLRPGIGNPDTEGYLNALNQQLLDDIQRSGEVFVSNAVVGGRYALRACVVNFNTTSDVVDSLPEIIARLGRAADGKLRDPASGDAAYSARA